ncbi:MAG: HD domain-containing protein [Planctomycetes bacterium]|nr:HD domain-containing protein [Planctomycetota bacterium]
MSKRYIADLKAGEQVESQVFLVSSKDLRTTTNGAMYIHAVLKDRSGQVPARMWQASEILYNTLPEGGFVELKGRAENYKGNMQFIIDAIRPIDEKAIDFADFLPASTADIDQLWTRTLEILRTIKDKNVQLLVKQFVGDEDLITKFKRSPAAATMHHAYIGGLCEHTLNLLEIAVLVIPRYPEVSLDLVLAGLFLHDIGKTRELRCETSFAYSDPGQLLGHLFIAAAWVDEKCAAAERETGEPFPEDIKITIQHIILSHHGSYEFGSPKIPATPEAVAIHHIDNLDAKLNTYIGLIKSDRDKNSKWTNYNHLLGTKVYKADVLGQRPQTEA